MEDRKVTVNIKSEKEVTADEVVREADKIWKFARARKLKFGDTEKTNELLKEVQKKHPQFSQAYPIVVRYMCQMQEYNSKAFRMWLLKIKEHPWKNPAEYMDAQADYVTRLYIARKPHANKTEINNLRSNVRTLLTKEYETFKSCAETTETNVTQNEKQLQDKNSDELFKFVKVAGIDGMSKAGTYRVETELPMHGESLDYLINKRICSEEPTNQMEMTADDLL